jgi:hypothetical protein
MVGMSWHVGSPDDVQGNLKATIPEIEARIQALWAKGRARTPEESLELGRLLTALKAEMPPGDFYTHVLEVLHISARTAQRYLQQYRASQGADRRPLPDV